MKFQLKKIVTLNILIVEFNRGLMSAMAAQNICVPYMWRNHWRKGRQENEVSLKGAICSE